ncbi:MAG: TetR family transcriptional regulator [Succinivibrio sp.]|nr:TetR family transcriptional regulator [Succinivibrio sp.]
MPRRTPEEAEKTRQSILKAAAKLFIDQGYEQTSLSDIATAAGVTRGAIYWHFDNKSDLMCELCEALASDRLNELLYQATNPDCQDPLSYFKLWLLAHSERDSVQYFSSAIFKVVDRLYFVNEEVHDKLNHLVRELHEQIQAMILNCIKKGQLPAELDVGLATDSVIIFIVGYLKMVKLDMAERVISNFPMLVEHFMMVLPNIRGA